MVPMKYSKIIVVAVAILASAAPRAGAQSSTAQAETLFRQGKDLMARGKLAEACAAFDASQKLDPTLATLLNQASCREKNGQLATAWGLFLEAERQSRSATDDATRQLHQVAQAHAAKLEPRLSTLAINVAADNRVGGLEILRNNDPVDPGAWNKPLPVDGGTYKITARAPGNTDWSSTVTVGPERDAKTIEPPKLKAAALAPHADPGGRKPPSVASGAPGRSRLLPFILGGVGLGLGGGALGFELSARSNYDKSKLEADNARQDSLYNTANSRRHVAQALGVGAVACLGAAVFLYFRRGSPESASSSDAHAGRLLLQPILDSDQAGLVLSGSY
jgi:tetratricopeptide (TPR) repeat protein